MALIMLRAETARGKYGVVTVYNEDATFNREYRITASDLATLHASGNGLPPGCTRSEWVSGKVVVVGKDFEAGDIEERDGHILVKLDERTLVGRLSESFLRFAPGEWSGVVPLITVPQAIIDALDQSRINVRVRSIIAGVVEID